MEIKGTLENGVIRVVLKGRLDVAGAMTAEQAFLKYAESGKDFVLDFAGVDYITSAGIRSLLTLYRTVSERGGSVAIVDPCDQVRDVLRETAFAELFQLS